jgi:hypothetical protein
MTLCPRCAADNEPTRAACWNCYAPLQGTAATKVKPMTLVGTGGITVTQTAVADDTMMEPLPGGPPPAAEPAKKRGLFGLGGKKK